MVTSTELALVAMSIAAVSSAASPMSTSLTSSIVFQLSPASLFMSWRILVITFSSDLFLVR